MNARDHDTILDERLRRALRPMRPDADAFRRGVQQKIEQRRSSAPRSQPRRSWARAAAALFVPSVFAKHLLAAGMISKQVGTVALKVLALPAFTMLFAVAAFVGSVKKLRAPVARGEERSPGSPRFEAARKEALRRATDLLWTYDPVTEAWWRQHKLLGTLSYIVPMVLVFISWRDAFVVFNSACMGAAVIMMSQLSREEREDRQMVAHHCGKLMELTLGYGLVVLLQVGDIATLTLVIAGALFISWQRRTATWLIVVHASLCTLLLAWVVAGLIPQRRADLVHYVEAFAEPSSRWETWGRMVSWLRRSGVHLDLSHAEQVLRASDRNAIRSTLANADLLTDEEWDQIARDARASLEGGSQFIGALHARALMRDGGLSPEEVPPLVQHRLYRLDRRSVEEYERLAHMLDDCELLEILGQERLLEDKRSLVHDVLRRGWVPQGGYLNRGEGGFDSHGAASVEETDAAIELMMRFGVPEGIDIHVVRDYLKGKARHPWPFERSYAWEARLALDKLDHGLRPPGRTPLQLLLHYRVAISTLLLVALCVHAILRAPKVAPRALTDS